MRDPILIAAPTRCGTTFLAWLLHLHGVWIGEGRVTKAPETNPQVPTENTAIKTYLRGVSGVPADFRDGIEALVETDGPWLFKSASILEKQDAWLHHFPEARWLCPFRPVEDCVASKMRHPGMNGRGRAENEKRTALHFKLQYRVLERARHRVAIPADVICGGGADGEHAAREMFDWLGIEFDHRAYHDWVQPERWNNGG
jgi:hypothetical protein